MRIGIIGATGWLGSALGARLLDRGTARADDLVLLNRSGPLPAYHGHSDVHWAADARDLVARSDVIVLSVRPADWRALELNCDGKLVVSFMAGVRSQALTGINARLVRAMPNASAELGRSYSPWWAADDVTDADRHIVTKLLSAIGTENEIASEDHIDLMSAVPGSGAAYPALMAVVMAEFLTNRGVDQLTAWRSAEGAVCGGARLLEGRIETAPALVAAYRDYAGVTAAGIEAAEREGFVSAIRAALAAATEAAGKLG